jgi:hypothetical protein
VVDRRAGLPVDDEVVNVAGVVDLELDLGQAIALA